MGPTFAEEMFHDVDTIRMICQKHGSIKPVMLTNYVSEQGRLYVTVDECPSCKLEQSNLVQALNGVAQAINESQDLVTKLEMLL